MSLQSKVTGERPRAAWQRSVARLHGIAAFSGAMLVGGSLGACSGESTAGPKEITATRLATRPTHVARTGLTMLERTHGVERVRAARQAAEGPGATNPAAAASAMGKSLFLYDLPDGWEALPPTQFRAINLRLSEAPSTELVLSFLPSDGGGLVPNIDRWRGQVGLGAMTDAEVKALESIPMLGQAATYVELFGPYQGMSGPLIESGGIVGAVSSNAGGTLFAKMTGEQSVLEAQREVFRGFVASLKLDEEVLQAAGVTRPTDGPSSGGSSSAESSSGGAPAARTQSPVIWEGPAGWTEEPGTNQFREVTFRAGGVEMYVSTARGGAQQNINRWAGQLGLEPLDAAGIEAMQTIQMMGRPAYLFEGRGSLQGMGDPAPKAGQMMLAALVEGGGQIVTVKAVGPADAVEAARADFLSLVGSIQARPTPR